MVSIQNYYRYHFWVTSLYSLFLITRNVMNSNNYSTIIIDICIKIDQYYTFLQNYYHDSYLSSLFLLYQSKIFKYFE